MSSQYHFGKSQKMWVWSPISTQPLLHDVDDSLVNVEVTRDDSKINYFGLEAPVRSCVEGVAISSLVCR